MVWGNHGYQQPARELWVPATVREMVYYDSLNSDVSFHFRL